MVAICFVAGLALGQIPQAVEPATKLERFLQRKNLLLIKETHPVGAVPGLERTEVRVEAVALSAPSERAYGVRLVRSSALKDSAEREGIIDYDEVGSFMEALDHMLRAASEEKPADESSAAAGSVREFTIMTRGGVRGTLVQTGRQFLCHLQLSGPAEESSVSFGIGALGRLRNLLGRAREKLVALGAR